jgi:hypothetical protein
MAGNNVQFTIWRMSNASDDSVGGAVITGSAVYTKVQGFFQEIQSNQILLQQGLETLETFKARIIPGTLVIYRRDEVEITKPLDHPRYGERFRVVNTQYSSHLPRDPRNYILLDLTRSVRMHRRQ